MKFYFNTRSELAQYVEEALPPFDLLSPLTMTIIPEKYGGFSVHIVTNTSSEDTEEIPSKQSTIT